MNALVDLTFSRLATAVSKTPFQTVRADFPHTAYRWSSRGAALRGLRVADGSAQAMKPEGVEEARRSSGASRPARRFRPLRLRSKRCAGAARRSSSTWLNFSAALPVRK